MKVAILGSGNGGCAAAADWALHGHEVRIFDFKEFPKIIEAINLQGGIKAEGELEGFAKIEYAGHCIEKAIEGADLILAIGPSFSSEPFANAVKDIINDKQLYVVCPGSFGGALITKKIFEKNENSKNVIVSETSTLPYASRITEPGSVKIFLKLRGGLYLSAIPSSQTPKVMDAFMQVYPNTTQAKNVFHTMLQNANPVIHPSVTLLNAGLIERTHGNFYFYEDGVTPAVGRLIEAVDRERLEIAKKLGVTIIPDNELGVLQGYMTEASYEYGYATAPGFKGIKAQDKLDHRYLNEDVGFGLVFMSNLAKDLGIDTPIIDSVINIASAIMKRDYRNEAPRTLKGMGYTVEEVLSLI
ncbi:MAG: NAD/NADP octopine/nopaline dehydrogenase family protein [Clostridiales bacterium]|nr:NAD/NADP octopine/nopaline dehydrogenase family protein [Clostridiales bacterium]